MATPFVDPEIALILAQQLVVPSDNARYVLNAVNSRWDFLYDALGGFDVIPNVALNKGEDDPSGFNSKRSNAVIDLACNFLDAITPLAGMPAR